MMEYIYDELYLQMLWNEYKDNFINVGPLTQILHRWTMLRTYVSIFDSCDDDQNVATPYVSV